jgi:prepilin-type N-terminal cleavage/methylation domain-containing protein
MLSVPKLSRQRGANPHGMTLVEVMVVVVIIGLLAATAVPAVQRHQRRTQNTRFINDLRVIRDAIEVYTFEKGRYPRDGNAGLPPELNPLFPPERWSRPTPIGGAWDWDYKQFGFTAGISVYQPTVNPGQMREIDRMIDDGDLDTGIFRSRSAGYIYILQF